MDLLKKWSEKDNAPDDLKEIFQLANMDADADGVENETSVADDASLCGTH